MLSPFRRRPALRPSNRRFEIGRSESLEARILPTVSATFSKGVVTLTGDATAADLKFETIGGSLVITSNTGPTIKYNNQFVSQATIAGAVSLKGTFLGGDDKLDFENGLALTNVTLNLGGGTNTVTVKDSALTGLFSVTGGAGIDNVEFNNSTLNAITLSLGYGDDDVEFKGATVNGTVSVNTSNGLDKVKSQLGTGGIANHFNGSVSISTGNQADEIELKNATFTNLTIAAGADNDEVTLDTVTITGRLSLDAGAGDDDVTIDGLTQSGATANSLVTGSGVDELKLKGSTFVSSVSINMGAGPGNELEIDDAGFSSKCTIVSSGVNDSIKIEQDLARSGLTNFVGALAITLGSTGDLKVGDPGSASYTQAQSTVTIKGVAGAKASVVVVRSSFTSLPVVKNVEWTLV